MTNRELREKAEADGEPEWRYRPVNDRLPPEDAGKTLPPYFAETVEEKNRRVNKIMSEMVLPQAFVFFSDAHIRQNSMSSVPVIRSILENTGVKDVIYGGDTVSGWVDNDMMYEDVRYFNRAYGFAKPYIVRGNHDMEGKEFELSETGFIAPEDDVLREIFPLSHRDSDRKPDTTYYTLSREKTKTVFIVIDTNEIHERIVNPDGSWGSYVCPSEEQIKWFASALLAIPAHRSAIVVGHTPVYKELAWSYDGSYVFGEMIEAYNRREKVTAAGTGFDFSSARGRVIMTLCGHGHVDDFFVTLTGNLAYEITCDANIDNGGGIYPRISGTPSESAVDAVIIDPPTGRISTVRYGAGIDREFVIRN